MAHAGDRRTQRAAKWRQRAAAAGTAMDEFVLAADRLRSDAAHACRPRRDTGARARGTALAEEALRDAARAVNAISERLERDTNDEHGGLP